MDFLSKHSRQETQHLYAVMVQMYNGDFVLTFSSLLFHRLTHRRLSTFEYKKDITREGLEPEYADFLVIVELRF
jgi:hypothetical protein